METPTGRDRTAVVTGGASGIGRSIAERLGRDGMNVAVLDVDAAGAEAVAAGLAKQGVRSLGIATDVSRADAVAAAARQVHDELGAVQVLVNDAGICHFVPFAQLTAEQWERTLAVNLTSMFVCVRTFLDDMLAAGWGRIVNLASVAGLSGGGPALVHYSTSKAGVIGFTKALAHEVGPHGVTVNAIAPGLIDTPMVRSAGTPAAIFERTVQHTPMRRVGTPEDVAAACAYLVSDEASFVTGQVLSPNGGAYL
jgi:2-hydroxycyclohexanecarboxyl-CoA dehydrogenase